jgi:glyceraldehyde 3-phosphate dehydrogenase
VNARSASRRDGRSKASCESDETARLDRLPGNPHSSIVDSAYTKVMDGDFVKVLSWYDNEWGYSSRCVDLLRLLVKKGL